MAIFSELVTSIVSDLHQAGFVKDAEELQHLASMALYQNLSRDVRRDVLKQIAMRCHVKWLGDFYLPHLAQKEWWEKLERLARVTEKHMQSVRFS